MTRPKVMPIVSRGNSESKIKSARIAQIMRTAREELLLESLVEDDPASTIASTLREVIAVLNDAHDPAHQHSAQTVDADCPLCYVMRLCALELAGGAL